ncbi:MAG: dTDP-4-dehydrorhamnose 3,5-epimerase [Candidatus Omnitrophica bacterium]|nr:dTDP-4-dehydrorhamnose 3,5-epimerase [Candidatus Omnitrophota bacterium]
MPIALRATEIPEVLVVEPQVFPDARGIFFETYRQDAFEQHGIRVQFVQDNYSYSSFKGSVRGLHYQVPPNAQAKLVHVIRGKMYDVAVDLRRASPTFGKHVAVELSDQNHWALYIPEGFAHGFQTLEDDTVVIYKVSRFYSRGAERGVRWNDPALGIQWPGPQPNAPQQLSERDLRYPALKDAALFP